MLDKRVISIRFHQQNREDMKLYAKLCEEASDGASLASVVKNRIKLSYLLEDQACAWDEMKDIVRIVIQDTMKGYLIEAPSVPKESENTASVLPAESDELPAGAIDFLL